jgi:hypothetical protein
MSLVQYLPSTKQRLLLRSARRSTSTPKGVELEVGVFFVDPKRLLGILLSDVEV